MNRRGFPRHKKLLALYLRRKLHLTSFGRYMSWADNLSERTKGAYKSSILTSISS